MKQFNYIDMGKCRLDGDMVGLFYYNIKDQMHHSKQHTCDAAHTDQSFITLQCVETLQNCT